MKISLIILALTLVAVPTDKIQCNTDTTLVAVECVNAALVKKIFDQHGFEYRFENTIEKRLLVVGRWPKNKHATYKQTRDLFFDLAKRKEVIRIY